MLINMFSTPLRQIADKFNVMQMGIIAVDRVFEIRKKQETFKITELLKQTHFKGLIQLKDVRFSYIKNEEVLKGINLEVQPAGNHCYLGSTGAGKSTIINLLNRFYEIDSGEIAIDNRKH